jgi:phosphoadenosine phosphosulfate reductase
MNATAQTATVQTLPGQSASMDAPDHLARLADLRFRYKDADAEGVVRAMITREFPGKIALVSSFGTESASLLHMVAQVDRATPIIFLDTGKLFGETQRYREQLVNMLGFTDVRRVLPDPKEITTRDSKGVLWSQNHDACCALRKIEPLERALKPFAAWFTGRKAYQSSARARLQLVEWEGGYFKINPLVTATRAEIEEYFARNNLPRHILENDGYLSVGCMPCTDRVAPGEDQRAGRWRGSEKNECGIHRPLADIVPSC